jgi:Lrp/AsnC family transcriptional regulator for asnA, asnC and gidA
MSKKLDLYDKKILHELDKNSRISSSEISRKIKLPKETVNYRIKRFLKRKYIKYFYTIVNASRLGYNYYKVFLKFHKLPPSMEKELILYIKHDRNCMNLRVTEGDYDLVFLSVHKSPSKLRKFLQKFSNKFGKYLIKKSIHIITTSYKLNQRMLPSERRSKIYFYHDKCVNEKIDDLDLKIISILSRKAREKLVNIGRELNENSRVIKYRIKKLQKLGVIVGYSTEINLDKFKKRLVQIDISLKNLSKILSVIEYFDQTNKCSFIYELVGEYDVSVELYISSEDELRKILRKFKETFLDHYIRYTVSHIYKNFTLDWSPFKEENKLDSSKKVKGNKKP